MKRLLVVFALALGMLLPVAASGQLLTFQLPQELLDFIAAAPANEDLVAGEGKVINRAGVTFQTTLSAHGTPTDAHGSFRLHSADFSTRGEVDCLLVVGNSAAASGTLRETGAPFAVIVEDNGEPSANNPTPDRVGSLTGGGVEPGDDCGMTQLLAFNTMLPVEQGNFVVMNRP